MLLEVKALRGHGNNIVEMFGGGLDRTWMRGEGRGGLGRCGGEEAMEEMSVLILFVRGGVANEIAIGGKRKGRTDDHIVLFK